MLVRLDKELEGAVVQLQRAFRSHQAKKSPDAIIQASGRRIKTFEDGIRASILHLHTILPPGEVYPVLVTPSITEILSSLEPAA